MKPYRGTLLATAVLLAALPLSSCGDADDWKTTSAITISATPTSVVVKRDVTVTVRSTPPTDTYNACETLLEYRAQGAGMDGNWYSIPGTETTRVFSLQPRQTGTLSLVARGKCSGAREDWKYSTQTDVAVIPVTADAVVVTLSANPATVEIDKPVTFSLSATKPETCTLKLYYEYSGAGLGINMVDPASQGQFILTPTAKGTLTVTATGYCTQTPTAKTSVTTSVTVTEPGAATLPTVTSVTLALVTPTPYDIPTMSGGIDYTLSAVTSSGCTLILRRQHSGSGLTPPNPDTYYPTTPGLWNIPEARLIAGANVLSITALGWCSENPSAIVTATSLNVTIN